LREPATGLNATAISKAIGGTVFVANNAKGFGVSGISNGSFLALNDDIGGYQSGVDDMIFLEGFIPNAANPITVV
jgi:hypothetical protein